RARGRARPAQQEPTPLVPARLEADGRREGDHLFHGLSLLVRRLAARQPRVDEDGQVLLVLLLEFLDHQLAAPGRRPPVDPPRAIAGAVIAQAVVFHLLRRAIVALAAAMFAGLALDQEPAAGQLPDPGIDDDLVGQRDRDAMLDDPEGRARADIEVAEA